jgi:hypothetical protein
VTRGQLHAGLNSCDVKSRQRDHRETITRCNLTFYQWFIMRRNNLRNINKGRTLGVELCVSYLQDKSRAALAHMLTGRRLRGVE